MSTAAAGRSRRDLRPSLGAAGGIVLAAAALVMGLRSLGDNSFFTHLATGRLILERGSVPSTDPYTFTAQGRPWVVQSWLASWLYASAERLAGGVGLRLLMGATFAGVAAIGWRLTRAVDGLVARLTLGVLFVAGGGELWAERPLMLGLVCFGCAMLASQGSLDRRWLLVLGWIWVNVHGSFPLGVVYLVVAAVGVRLDGERPVNELGALRWLVAGIVGGAVGPVGPRLLVFPLELLRRQDVLTNVTEWRAPTFDSFSQRMFVVQLVLAIVLLVRRPSYRAGFVLAAFGAAALLGSRNLTVASLAILPAMAAATPSIGSLKSSLRSPLSAGVAFFGVAAALLLGAVRLGEPDFALRSYPIDALAYVQVGNLDLHEHRLATQDVVGNLQELLYGAGDRVFYDDRFDMFSRRTSSAHLQLVRGGTGVRKVLLENGIEVVLWGRSSVLGQRLLVDPSWRALYADDDWVLLCSRGAELGGRFGRC